MSAVRYRLSQVLLAPGARRCLSRRLAGLEAARPAGQHLDVGCGPSSWLWDIGLKPFGVDRLAPRAAAFGRHGSPVAQASAVALPFPRGAFDGVWSFGLLHHLSDDEAHSAVAEMIRVTRVGGWTVLFDAVLPERPWRRPVAALLRWLDQGAWMRRQERLRVLVDPAAGWACERFTYAYTGLEGLLCVLRKRPSTEGDPHANCE